MIKISLKTTQCFVNFHSAEHGVDIETNETITQQNVETSLAHWEMYDRVQPLRHQYTRDQRFLCCYRQK
jgi:hypothetical protein